MNSVLDYLNTKHDKEYKYAPFWKRILSTIIDLIIIYPFYFIIYAPNELSKYKIIAVFICSLAFQYIFYKVIGRTLGELILKVKPVFVTDIKNKSINLFTRAFIKSTIYVPFGLSLISLIFAFVMVVCAGLFS